MNPKDYKLKDSTPFERVSLGVDTANPKHASGAAKIPLELWPSSATYYGAIGLLEGKLKYGRLNWRATKVYASIYIAAAMRHMSDWMEGEEFTAEGGPHLGNALACLAILVDAKTNGTMIDDRNFTGPDQDRKAMIDMLDSCARVLKEQFKDRDPKHYDQRDNAER